MEAMKLIMTVSTNKNGKRRKRRKGNKQKRLKERVIYNQSLNIKENERLT